MLTGRQEQILNLLVKEYIDDATPVSSDLLKKRLHLDISPATIRNDLQELTELGYVVQPHPSAGRVPTEKGYHYFVEVIFLQNQNLAKPGAEWYLEREINEARQKIEKELALAKKLTESLQNISTTLSYTKIQNKSFDPAQDRDHMFEIIKIIGPTQSTHSKNISLIEQLLRELENF